MNIKTIESNWNQIKKMMTLANKKGMTYREWCHQTNYAASGLSDHALTIKGNGALLFFLEKLPELSFEFLQIESNSDERLFKIAHCISYEEFSFIKKNIDFLKNIK